jgi:hypothetical protein
MPLGIDVVTLDMPARAFAQFFSWTVPMCASSLATNWAPKADPTQIWRGERVGEESGSPTSKSNAEAAHTFPPFKSLPLRLSKMFSTGESCPPPSRARRHLQ